MKNLTRIGIIILISLLAYSCQKEELITDTAKIENEIKSIVKSEGITKCNIFVTNGDTNTKIYSEVSFDINDGFIIIQERLDPYTVKYEKFNLTYLSKYVRFSGQSTINFYFSNIYPY